MNKGVTTLKNHFVTFTKYSQLSDNIKYIKIELKAKKEPNNNCIFCNRIHLII